MNEPLWACVAFRSYLAGTSVMAMDRKEEHSIFVDIFRLQAGSEVSALLDGCHLP
jgi:hypothetical protein